MRKVLGASVSSIATLFIKRFYKAGDHFHHRCFTYCLFIDEQMACRNLPTIFEYTMVDVPARGRIIAILLALATVSFQAIRAAVVNPVKSLRTE